MARSIFTNMTLVHYRSKQGKHEYRMHMHDVKVCHRKTVYCNVKLFVTTSADLVESSSIEAISFLFFVKCSYMFRDFS